MPEFRVYLREQCLINPPPEPRAKRPGKAPAVGEAVGALLALFAPKLIESALTGIASALKKAGAKETAQLTAHDFSDLYVADDKQALTVTPSVGCILGVWFEDESDRKPHPGDPAVRTLKEAGLVPDKAVVGGVFEAMIRSSADGTAFFLDTRYFGVWDFIGDRRKDSRDYIVTLNLTTPDATAEGSTFALGNIDLGRRRRGDILKPGQLDGFPRYRSNLMPWSMISQASRTVYERDVAAEQAARRHYMPATFSLTVSETADGNQFLFKLGEVLAGLAGEAATEISKKILPSETGKAAAEAAANAETLYEEELKAEMELCQAQKAYDEAGEADKPAMKVALEIARRKLAWRTRLREAAGLKAPDPV